MAIRFANMTDLPAMVEIASRMHALTRFKSFPFSAQRTTNSIAALIQTDKGKYAAFVAENSEGKVVGALIGVMEQHIFSESYVASIMHIDVLPESRMGGYGVRLIKAFEQWARNRNAFEICFGVNSGSDIELQALIERLGYTLVGGNFAMQNEASSVSGKRS
jgi:GNAT superfamily N-acetyltransferase